MRGNSRAYRRCRTKTDHLPDETGECLLADPRVRVLRRCARVATSALSARTVRQQQAGPGGAAGRGSRFDHARTAGGAGRHAAHDAGRGRGGAHRPAHGRSRGRRHRPHGGRQLGPAQAQRAGRSRPDQRDPGLAVPGRARAARRGPHARPHGPPRLRRAHPGARRLRTRRGTPPDPQRGHPGRQHRLGRAHRGRAARTGRPGGDADHRGPGRSAPGDPGVAPAGRCGDAPRRRTHRLRARAPAARPAGLPEGHRQDRPRALGRVRRGRPRPRQARGQVRRRSHSADAAQTAGRRAVGGPADRLGQQPHDRPRSAERLRGVRRRGLHPRPGTGRGRLRGTTAPAVLHLRRTVAALARRALGRALS